jgi:hypothetical protein
MQLTDVIIRNLYIMTPGMFWDIDAYAELKKRRSLRIFYFTVDFIGLEHTAIVC